MKILKIILFSLLGIMFAFLASNFFFDKSFNVDSSIEIKSSPYLVFSQVENFENWPNWDPWMAKDSTVVISLADNISQVGAIREWKSKSSADGYLKLISNEFIKQLDYGIYIDNSPPFYTTFYFESDSTNGVIVSCKHSGKLPFLSRVFGPFLKKMIQNDQVNGLNNLKQYCESLPSKTSEITIEALLEKKVIAIEDSCVIGDFDQALSDIYQSIFVLLAENGIMPTSSPFVQHISFPRQAGNANTIVFRAGVFVETPVDTNNTKTNAKYYETMPSNSVQATHIGDLQTINDTHYKIKQYCLENNYKIVGFPYEIYLSDPNMTPNVSEWKTRVIYQIE